MAGSAQKFIIANPAPRVHTGYDLALHDAAKALQLPFVVGVLGDLGDAALIDARSIEEPGFFNIEVGGFDGLLKGMALRASFDLPEVQPGEGAVAVQIAYESLTDFTPDAITARAEALRPLLEGRSEFKALTAFLEGDTAILPPEVEAQANVLDALRSMKLPEPEEDTSGSVLDSLRSLAGGDTPQEDTSAAALDALRSNQIAPEVSEDTSAAALDELRKQKIVEDTPDDSGATLDALRAMEIQDDVDDGSAETLDALRRADVPDPDTTDHSAEVLAALPTAEVVEDKTDQTETILAGIEAVDEVEEEDISDAVLAGIEAIEDTAEDDDIEDVLAGLEAPEAVEETDDLDAILSDIEAPVEMDDGDTADDILAGIEAVDEAEEEDSPDAVLAGIEAIEDTAEDDDIEDVLAGLETPEAVEETDDLDSVLSGLDHPEAVDDDASDLDDILAGLDPAPVEEGEDAPEVTDAEDLLAGLEETAENDDLDAILAGSEPSKGVDAPAEDDLGGDEAAEPLHDDLGVPDDNHADDNLDGLLDVSDENGPAETAVDEPENPTPIDDILQDEPATEGIAEEAPLDDTPTEEEEQDARELDALLADLQPDTPDEEDDDLDALLGALEDEPEEEPAPAPEAIDDLDALLAGLQQDTPEVEEEEATDQGVTAEDDNDDLDGLLAGLDEDPLAAEDTDGLLDRPKDESTADADDMDALLAGLDEDIATSDDADAGAADDGKSDMPADTEEMTSKTKATLSAEPELAYGTMGGERPDAQKLERKRFRIAILGDFTGRSAHGLIDVGDALASRKPIFLDPDTVEDVIEGFATTLVLPIGKDGAGVEVKLGGLDDLHPDELYENVELFSALKSLKSQLNNGGTADNAAKSLVAWGEQHGRAVAPARATSGGNTVRADLKLSDFQKLIGDTERKLAQPSPVDELMARVVGPHIRKLPDPNVTAMAGAVDDALSGAMRMVLHHPEFQSVEAQWRALDLIARSIETDDTLEVMLYDVSAEEIAADLTQSDDLSTSGLARLLTEGPMDEEFGRGAYSALIGMYTFEETPPHAQLLGRIARVAAHVDAPFFAAITPGFIETAKKDRHPLVATEWDTLRAMPEAGHLALATPRFLMRRPYGAKTEPIYEFEFEEFTQSAGLSGMLWANPVVLVAILLAKSFKENGPSMGLGQIMSLGDMPYHFVLDRYGDQVALPCTERNLTLDKVETVLGRGYLPVVSIKGRDEIRLASFQSLGGGEILGPWSGVKPPPPSAPKPPKAAPDAMDGNDKDAAGDDDDLDDLLSGFNLDADDSDEDIDNDEDMDAELAALLADL
ncbi:MAG: type VI secretion system contractile sheath large subunit [Sulfitobacter sp.]